MASDIEIIPDGEYPIFTGVPTTGTGILSRSDAVTRAYKALDLAVFGAFSYKSSQMLHTIELTGFQPNRNFYTAYV